MNPGLLGLPRGGAESPPFRFLDTTGLVDMPGDVSRFTAAHIRADAGAAIPGVWRPVDADTVPSLSIERGCLLFSEATGTTGAAHMAVPADVDVVLEFLPGLPLRDTNLEYIAGCYLEDAGAGNAAMLRVHSGVVETITEGASTRTPPVVTVLRGSVNLLSSTLPVTPSDYTTASTIRVGAQPLLFRLKRIGAQYGTYFSPDGHTWLWLNSGGCASGASTLGVFAKAESDLLAPRGDFRIAGMKFLDPNTAFPT